MPTPAPNNPSPTLTLPDPDRNALLERLRALAGALDRRHITQEQFQRETGVSHDRVRHIFGNHGAMLRAAGLATYQRRRLTKEELLRSLRDACVAAGGVNSRAQAAHYGAYSQSTYLRHWRSWRDVLAALRHWATEHDPGFAWLSSLPLQGGTMPTGLIRRRTGSPLYGAPLNIRGMLHEPVNEQGVLVLFGALAQELDFAIERVGTGFPDCEAKQRVGAGWRRVRIEFEYLSRNFRDHKHDAGGCDLIVCWQHNWPDCPLEVLELKTEVNARGIVRSEAG